LENGVRKCVSCAEEMEMVQCSAEKFVGKSENSNFVLIKHIGNHKCLHKSVLESQVLEEIENFFELNPTATRSEAIVHHLVNKINFGTKEDVIDLVSISLNIWEINNCKQKGIKRLNPHGSKMDAVRHLKAKLEEIQNPYNIILKIFDDIYICSICNEISESSENTDCVKVCANCSMTPMEHIGPSVFISSKESLATLRELSANRSLATEACCLDHQPSRLRQYTTFAAYAYDLDLRKMCPLFASVMNSEKELAVYHSLDVVDRCLLEQFETDNKFNPNLIIADEASSIKNAVARKLGREKI
jgi:rubrerythrin